LQINIEKSYVSIDIFLNKDHTIHQRGREAFHQFALKVEAYLALGLLNSEVTFVAYVTFNLETSPYEVCLNPN
jgi:hypothetical protein